MSSDRLFCPSIGGPCIGKECMAYTDSMTVDIIDGNKFIKKAVGKETDYELPMTFMLKVGGCLEYDKIVDKSSSELVDMFNKEIME